MLAAHVLWYRESNPFRCIRNMTKPLDINLIYTLRVFLAYNRHAPEYVLRLLEYYIQNEGLAKKKVTDECSELEERGGLHEKN